MNFSLTSKVLNEFLSQSVISGGELGERLSVSRNAVHKAITSLKQEGFLIESQARQGYKFLGDGDVINKSIISRYLKTKNLGRSLDVLEQVDSTNSYLKRKLPLGEGYAVVSDCQINGMGRKGRIFYSPKGGLYLSFVLKPNLPIAKLQFLTICAALAVCRALKEVCDFDADVKWVNDIYYDGKKLCGISTDASFSAELLGVEHVIMGIGINLLDVANEVSNIATSVKNITGKTGFRNRLIASVLNNMQSTLGEFYDGGTLKLIDEYRQKLFIINKTVTVVEGDKEYTGVVHSITNDGGLSVQIKGQGLKIFRAGEISLIIS